MFNTSTKQKFAIFAGAVMVMGLSQPASAQSTRAQVRAEIARLADGYPGSTAVYAGCRAVAEDDYARTGSVSHALGALTGCSSVGCVLTDVYTDCLRVNARLFVLELRLS